jgi:hypothetical protein
VTLLIFQNSSAKRVFEQVIYSKDTHPDCQISFPPLVSLLYEDIHIDIITCDTTKKSHLTFDMK